MKSPASGLAAPVHSVAAAAGVAGVAGAVATDTAGSKEGERWSQAVVEAWWTSDSSRKLLPT